MKIWLQIKQSQHEVPDIMNPQAGRSKRRIRKVATPWKNPTKNPKIFLSSKKKKPFIFGSPSTDRHQDIPQEAKKIKQNKW